MSPATRYSIRALLVAASAGVTAYLNVPAGGAAAITGGLLAAVEAFTPVNPTLGWNKGSTDANVGGGGG